MKNNVISKHLRYFTSFAWFYCGFQVLVGQNLVMNPSFEDFVQCPETYGTFQDDVPFWTCPTNGSTDYFNNCSRQMAPHRNFAGKQKAFDGNGYAGFYAFGPKDYREYISGELMIELQKGKKYSISAMVSLSENSAYAVDEIGFLFGGTSLNLETSRNISRQIMIKEEFTNYQSFTAPKFLANKSDWMQIKEEYVASGTERYFTFGNFKGNGKTRMLTIDNSLKKAAYYYVDLVSIEEVDLSFNLDEIYVFEGLNFDVDGFKIENEGREELEPLIDYLTRNPGLNISIYGHTDNAGSKEYNKALSKKRAKSLSLFLVDNGLSPFRIAWHGCGEANPKVANETKEGREQNRRVEFIISEKTREFYASSPFEDENDN